MQSWRAFLCENHTALFLLDKVSYEIKELKIEVAEPSLINRKINEIFRIE